MTDWWEGSAVGPPPVPVSRGPSASPSILRGGPPRTPPRRSSSRFTTRPRTPTHRYRPNPATQCSAESVRFAVLDSRAQSGHAVAIRSERSEATSSSLVFETVRENSALRNESIQFHIERTPRAITPIPHYNSKRQTVKEEPHTADTALAKRLEENVSPPMGQTPPAKTSGKADPLPHTMKERRPREVIASRAKDAMGQAKANGKAALEQPWHGVRGGERRGGERVTQLETGGERQAVNLEEEDEEDVRPAAVVPMPHPVVIQVRRPTRGSESYMDSPSARRPPSMPRLELPKIDVETTCDAVHREKPQPQPQPSAAVGSGVEEAEHDAKAAKKPFGPSLSLLPTPTPVLRPTIALLRQEIHEWARYMALAQDMDYHRRYVQQTAQALDAARGALEERSIEHLAVDVEVRAAKARYAEAIDALHLDEKARQEGTGKRGDTSSNHIGGKRKGPPPNGVGEAEEEEEGEEGGAFSAELEAWRIEKGELLAKKATLLQKRKELQYHLRRGTNIKNIAGVARGALPRSELDEDELHNAPPIDDKETVQLRLELKEINVRFMKLVDTHRVLKETERVREKEFESEKSRLMSTAAVARQDLEREQGTLQGHIHAAEHLRQRSHKMGEDSLVLLLEQAVQEATAALRPRDYNSALGESIRSRQGSIAQLSNFSTPRRTRQTVSSASTPVATQVGTLKLI